MMYYTWTVGDKDYKLRMGAKACIDLEKRLGTNPINVLAGMDEGNIPSLELLLTILQAAMTQYNHGIDIEAMYGIYDNFVDAGNSLLDLVPVIIEVFKVSGLVPDGKETEDTDPN